MGQETCTPTAAARQGGGNGTGGGGGGRVALFYTNAASFTLANAQALAGTATADGSAGTVFLQATP